MPAQGYFITGTDTEIGKTRTTLILMQSLQARGMQVAGMKPVATGCERQAGGLRNADALALMHQASSPQPYAMINPYAFLPPIAPHLAAQDAGRVIDFAVVIKAYDALAGDNDIVLVEGIGGWRVPMGGGRTLADLVRALRLPVILVAGLRLGCISHALLTAEAIQADGLPLAGWVANRVDPSYAEACGTIETLIAAIPAPYLGSIPFMAGAHPGGPLPLLDVDTLLSRPAL